MNRPYPPIAVVPRGPISQLVRSLFGDRRTATGDPTFDGRFQVHTGDPGYARWLIREQLVAAHKAGALPHWSLGGQYLLTYRAGSLRDPDMIPALAGPLLRVADLLPH